MLSSTYVDTVRVPSQKLVVQFTPLLMLHDGLQILFIFNCYFKTLYLWCFKIVTSQKAITTKQTIIFIIKQYLHPLFIEQRLQHLYKPFCVWSQEFWLCWLLVSSLADLLLSACGGSVDQSSDKFNPLPKIGDNLTTLLVIVQVKI